MYSYTRTDILGNNSRRFVEMTTKRKSAGYVPGKPWDMTISGSTASFANCVYDRGGLTKTTAPGNYIIAGADGDIFIGVEINLDDGTSEIIEGHELSDVTNETIPDDTAIIRKALYKIHKTTDGERVRFRVLVDYRAILHLLVYT
jgi:hypothetical protein